MKIFKKKLKILLGVVIALCFIYIVFPRDLFLDITKSRLGEENPTSYTFNVSVDSLAKLIGKQKYRIKNSNLECYKDLNIVYAIHMDEGQSNTKSYEYRIFSEGRRCLFVILFQIDSIASDKTVLFYDNSESDTEILCGKEMYFNLHGSGVSERWIKRKPSNIDIYETLRYIGKIVGEKNMPPIIYPKWLSKKQILETFGPDNPFTPQEQFGDKE